jgi:hypothetical protein
MQQILSKHTDANIDAASDRNLLYSNWLLYED